MTRPLLASPEPSSLTPKTLVGLGPSPEARRRAPSRERARRQAAALPPRALPAKLGPYLLFDHIGRGGMADLFVGSAETALGGERLVVVKELLPRLSSLPAFGAMLAAEARIAAELTHRNIVATLDLGRDEGTLYVTMEYVEGLDLRELLRGCVQREVGLPLEFSLHVVREVLSALDYAHRFRKDGASGVVHRDVSPSNVLLSFDGDVKLCDFGIARAMDAARGEVPAEAVSGKAGYMSPEQAHGEPLDGRADVFSAGVLLWELLAGRKLYRASPGPELLALARAAEIPPLPADHLPDPDEIRSIVAAALSPDRGSRPTAGELRADLDAWVANAGLETSALRFGAWLESTFGREMLELRRARLRAARALARGPAVVLTPAAPPEPPPPALESAPEVPPAVTPPAAEKPLQKKIRAKKKKIRREPKNRTAPIAAPAPAPASGGVWVAVLLSALGLGAALVSALR